MGESGRRRRRAAGRTEGGGSRVAEATPSAAPRPLGARASYLLVGAAAVLVQATQLSLLADDPSTQGPIVDGRDYHLEAARIASGGMAPEAPHFQSPFFPWLLALTYRLLGIEPRNGLYLQALLAVVIALQVLALARRMLPERAALAAGLAATAYGPLLFFSSQLIAAPLDAATALALLLVATRTDGATGPRGHLLLGLVAGVAVATRGTVAPVLAWLALRPWQAFAGSPERLAAAAHRVGALGAGVLLGMLPVGLSNWARSGVFSLSTTNLGVNLWIGNNPDVAATTAIRPGWQWVHLLAEPSRQGISGAFAESDYFRAAALSWALDHPLAWARTFLLKLADVFNGFEVPRNLDPYGELGRTALTASMLFEQGLRFPFGLVLPLAVLGAASLWRAPGSARAARDTVLFVVLNAVGIALFFPSGRYRLALALALVPLAIAGLAAALRTVRAAAARALPARGALAAALAVLAAAFANLMPPLTGPDMRDEEDYQQALAYRSANRDADAARLLARRLERRPDDADAWSVLAEARYFGGNRAGALEAVQHAVRHAPEATHAWHFLGVLLEETGRRAEADAAYVRATEIFPGHPLASTDLAWLRLDGGDFAGAVAPARQAVLAAPGGRAWLGLGLALLLTRQPQEAEEPLRRAAALLPAEPRARTGLARALAAQGRREEAEQHLKEVLARWPTYESARRLRDEMQSRGW